MWHILTVKSPNEGVHLNDPDRHPISSPDDERLLFLENMATSLKLMDNSKRGQRVRGLSSQTANAWHVSLLGTVDLVKTLLALGMKNVSFGKIQNDGLEGEYGVIRQLSGRNYHISVEQVISSVSLRRMKLYHKLEMHGDETMSSESVCCAGNLQDKDDDLELLHNCFSEASNFRNRSVQRCIIFVDMFRLTVYYICGYVSFNGVLYLWICFV